MASETLDVPMKAEEALRSVMKRDALKKCQDACKAYAECSHDKVFSVVWACRKEFGELNQCLKLHTTDEVLETYKKGYVDSQASK
mmetsp:Transcript_11346/g.21505  ORF Transcript_11346/g.21505 Transcript_11346/m.21505 type:complete len:85 (+) Transcript_11346:215-469(+)|eukprot:CAMPEP_0114255794 /NCGR_PEP_ID=MMETSP0058-20121206/17770_1 /TAXON_ID=36894 /ORGANISM="Pyramimonas parkeae, CCMP726" /LENGTH=84 /DNA_ID=CAMNT_0001370239 /DNA_START=179 /DNA_END=433 /DNA_ORIENTATION=-